MVGAFFFASPVFYMLFLVILFLGGNLNYGGEGKGDLADVMGESTSEPVVVVSSGILKSIVDSVVMDELDIMFVSDIGEVDDNKRKGIYIKFGNSFDEDLTTSKFDTVELVDYVEFETNLNEDTPEEEREAELLELRNSYFWLDENFIGDIVVTIKKELVRLDAENYEYFSSNTDTFLAKVEEEYKMYREMVKSSDAKSIIFVGSEHNVFAQSVGLEVPFHLRKFDENGESVPDYIREVIGVIWPTKYRDVYLEGGDIEDIYEDISARYGITPHYLVSPEEIAFVGIGYFEYLKLNMNTMLGVDLIEGEEL